MDVDKSNLLPQYQRILEECEPFVISYRGNWPHLDLTPFGVQVAEERLYCPTTLRSRGVIDDLHVLDGFSFGPQEMLMPRWVLYDCGEFPGMVFGFGRRAGDLPQMVRDAYKRADPEHFVALSMWVAIPCAEPTAWFGHNLSSANLLTRVYPGLATITKGLGMVCTKAQKQYGATQWDSDSIGVHMNLGDMRLLSAWTPAHTHIETLSYRIDVDQKRIAACMEPGFKRPHQRVDRTIASDDHGAMQVLQADIERGDGWLLSAVDRPVAEGAPQRIHLERLG